MREMRTCDTKLENPRETFNARPIATTRAIGSSLISTFTIELVDQTQHEERTSCDLVHRCSHGYFVYLVLFPIEVSKAPRYNDCVLFFPRRFQNLYVLLEN